jgi:uncharacterized membrane protein
MNTRSKLIVACLAVALVITFGVTTNAQAQCCFGNIIAAPFYAAAAVVGGAVSLVAGVVSYPFTCNAGCFAVPTCVTACSPCVAPAPPPACPSCCP